ncbi:MAG TPA: sulfatase-like hydrolase/transferase [archaeon]|nr:sulfatase-like hydrolase/transferase [archaeon]
MSKFPGAVSRRSFIKRVSGTALGAVFAAGLACGTRKKTGPPNILVINADDLGMGDLSSYGSEIPTPHIDSIGAQGVRFTDFYVSAPVCTPSRFSQLTGLMPDRSRHELTSPLMPTSETDSERGIEQGETTVAEVLREAGYTTALIGKWHLGHGNKRFLPANHGFDYFYGFTPGCIDYFTHRYRGEPCFYRNQELIEEPGYSTELFTREAVSFLEQSKGQPFYLNLAHNSPHYGKTDAPGNEANVLQAPEELVSRFTGPDKNRNIYSAMIVSMDNGVGEVLTALENLGLAGNTLVIFTSDNGGDPDYGGNNGKYRGEKGELFEGGIRIPCLMRWPGVIPAGAVSRQVGSHLDFFPTFASLAGAQADTADLDGTDISKHLLQPESAPEERTLYWDYGESRAVRSGKWKYLKDKEGEQYIFNLEEDPFETVNLIQKNSDLAVELDRRLEKIPTVI